jgi:2-polyprenyl-3-methyl-5-hydroxy-6-metoxy-1,4-benzoquinol methylase
VADDATRAAYDATAEFYARVVGTEVSPDFEGPLDRALLAAFAEVVQTRAGVVADIGCGPGRVAAFLAARGVEVVGVDPRSPCSRSHELPIPASGSRRAD